MASGAHTFFRTDLNPLRNKFGGCEGPDCEKYPAPGRKFSTCSACKVTLYCSKECQKSDWKRHKVQCKILREHQEQLSKFQSDRTSERHYENIVMLQDFHQCHIPWFSIAAYILCQRLGRPLDLRTEGMRVDLSCRMGGPEDNPATRYQLENMVLINLTELQRHSTPIFGRSPAEVFSRDGEDSQHDDAVTIVLTTGDWTCLTFRQRIMPGPEMVEAMIRLGDRWLEGFQHDIGRGLVPRINEDKLGLVMGTMVKQGRHWKWKEDDDLVSEVLGVRVPSIFDA